jgi:hypothetical protein
LIDIHAIKRSLVSLLDGSISLLKKSPKVRVRA